MFVTRNGTRPVAAYRDCLKAARRLLFSWMQLDATRRRIVVRINLSGLVLALAAGLTSPVEAQERRATDRKATASERRSDGFYRRPSTVDHRGLCQRDTGKPATDLKLDQRCDREEFWARFNDRGDRDR